MFLFFACILIITCCNNSEENQDIHNNENFVQIVSVNPSQGLIANVDTTFQIEIRYSFYSNDSASLYIGFNSQEPYTIFPWVVQEIFPKGSGTLTYTVKTIPINWGENAVPSPFGVCANLLEYPHNPNWFEYHDVYTDCFEITFNQNK